MENELKNLVKVYYSPSDSWEYYDEKNGMYYTQFGQELVSPEEYFGTDYDTECYVPMGDE